MMKKMWVVVVLICLAASLLAAPAYAASAGDIVFDRSLKPTDEFLVQITRPEGDESTFKKSYIISGTTELKDSKIKVVLAIVNKDGKLVPFENTDGESSWILEGETFFKEVVLPELGANSIRIAAYKLSDEANLKYGENIQINDYTITVLEESKKNIIQKGSVIVTDFLKNIFSF